MSAPVTSRGAMTTAGVSTVADKRFLRPDVRSAARGRFGAWRKRAAELAESGSDPHFAQS